MYNSKIPVQKQLVRQRKFQQRPQKRTFLLMVTEILHFHQETKKLGQRRFTEDNCLSNCLQTHVQKSHYLLDHWPSKSSSPWSQHIKWTFRWMANGDRLIVSIMWYELASYLFIFPIFRLVDLTNLGQFSFIVRVFDFWTIALEDNNRNSFNHNTV